MTRARGERGRGGGESSFSKETRNDPFGHSKSKSSLPCFSEVGEMDCSFKGARARAHSARVL